MTDIVVDPALQAYIDPLTPDEFATLERSILAEGCRDALVLWGNVLVDGHNRFTICQKHGLPFRTVQNERFQSLEDVQLWMIDQHLGRRSISDFQRGVMALRKREIVTQRLIQPSASPAPSSAALGDMPPWESDESSPAQAANGDSAIPTAASVAAAEAEALSTREALAKAARLSSGQLRLIETIQRSATPEIVAAVRAGDLSINAAAAVSQLTAQEQQAAAEGGKQSLQQAAKRVREARKKPKSTDSSADQTDTSTAKVTEDAASTDISAPAPKASAARVAELEQQVQTLTAENERLREQVKVLQELLAEQG